LISILNRISFLAGKVYEVKNMAKPTVAHKHHVLVKPGGQIPATAPRLARDGGPYTQRGTTANFNVFFENALGANGPFLADAVLANCEQDLAALQNVFGNIAIPNLPFNVYVVTGDFGAYHATCAATELHCAAFDGSNRDLVRMLMVAEADEVCMAAQGVGWNCGFSNGEALSRILATEAYPAQLDGFASASAWLNSNRDDFVNQNDPTDTNYISIGCAALFINYLRNQTGLQFALGQIVQNGGQTLTQTYQNVTGNNDDPFPAFADLLNTKFPAGTAANWPDDNPFPI
jgi:hypothetical protein